MFALLEWFSSEVSNEIRVFGFALLSAVIGWQNSFHFLARLEVNSNHSEFAYLRFPACVFHWVVITNNYY